jgi:signal transduction histidine kinase
MGTDLTLTDAVARIFDRIPDLATPSQVESSLREILGDETLELFWWDWEREWYVDVLGGRRGLSSSPERALTLVGYESRKIGAILHDPALLDAPEFFTHVVPTLRIAMERDRLHRDLVEKLEQLKASRLRIVQAGDEERRRLERNLHDGAQQRLVVVQLQLRRLRSLVEDDAQLDALARSCATELDEVLAELRELARGLHPPLLAREGLEAAVRAGALRSSLPIELDIRLRGGLPSGIEAAAYYVCAEAVTNASKHAQAENVWLSITQQNGSLTVEVRDDGVGGACIDCDAEASGLGGLLDRVEALGGRLELDSPDGAGTTLRATFPVQAA